MRTSNFLLWLVVLYLLVTRPWGCQRDYRQAVHNVQSVNTTEVRP